MNPLFDSPSDYFTAMRRCSETEGHAEERGRQREGRQRGLRGGGVDCEMSIDVFTYCI